MAHLLLVDGSNLLFQMFYGMPARIVNRAGKPIQGTLGFVGALLKILRLTQPTHVAVLFDGEHENPRAALDDAYKANRPDWNAIPEEETPFSQLPDILRALDCLGIAHAQTTDCETDDWIAAYVRAFGSDMQVTVSSFDSDFFQLIGDRVHVLRYRGEKTVVCDSAWLAARCGVTPAQYAGFKALTGDAADNIRGVEHVGPKTAAALMGQFGTLEALLAHPEDIARPLLRQAVEAAQERIRRNYRLILLSGDAALPLSLSSLSCPPIRCGTRDVLREIGLQ